MAGGEDPPFAGGSYVIVQKYLHDMRAWDALPAEEQEKVIGRTKLSNLELPDGIKPANSHVALTAITGPDGAERQILRDNMPFGSAGRGEFGTYFIGYAATPTVTSRCWRTCSWAIRPATTTGYSTSPPRSPAACSSCRPPVFSVICPARLSGPLPSASHRAGRPRPRYPAWAGPSPPPHPLSRPGPADPCGSAA
jgi:hypothetical protein